MTNLMFPRWVDFRAGQPGAFRQPGVVKQGAHRFLLIGTAISAVVGASVLLAGCTNKSSDPTTVSDTTSARDTAIATDSTTSETSALIASTTTLSATTAAVPSRPPTTIHVPGDAPTIQAAVDRSVPGDLVLVAAGVYREAVEIHTNDITVRGENRNTVILDGGDELENGIKVAADRVAIENLTAKRYTFNGLVFTKAYDDNADDPNQHQLVNGYRASYVTVANNQQYGIYAFFARGGLIEHSYASGHPDSGIYVGQCKPCDAVLRDVTAEHNSIGYEGTNSSGNLFIIDSDFSNNRVGMTPNSQNQERLSPQGDIVIAGTRVENNNDAAAPATAQGAFGVGIAVAGGNRNLVTKNLIRGNKSAGVIVTDLNGFQPEANAVKANQLVDNGTDLVYTDSTNSSPIPPRGNCFAQNLFSSSLPPSIESVLPCDSTANTKTSNVGPASSAVPAGPAAYRPLPPPPDVDYRSVALPGDQPTMDDPTSPTTRVSDAVPTVNLTTISIPKAT